MLQTLKDIGKSFLLKPLSVDIRSTWMFVFLLALCIVLWVLRLLSWIIGGTAGTAKDFVVALCCPRWRKPSAQRILDSNTSSEMKAASHFPLEIPKSPLELELGVSKRSQPSMDEIKQALAKGERSYQGSVSYVGIQICILSIYTSILYIYMRKSVTEDLRAHHRRGFKLGV